MSVKLSNNALNKAGGEALINALAYNQSIINFDISSLDAMRRNKVGPQGIESFKEILKFNKLLTCIDISGNCIGNEGIGYLCEGLKGNQYILSLKIAQNDITS